MLGDIVGCHIWERGCYWHLVVEARDAATHPAVHRTAPATEVTSPAGRQYHLGLRNPAVSASDFLTQPEEVLLLGYALEFERCYKKREIFCY